MNYLETNTDRWIGNGLHKRKIFNKRSVFLHTIWEKNERSCINDSYIYMTTLFGHNVKDEIDDKILPRPNVV